MPFSIQWVTLSLTDILTNPAWVGVIVAGLVGILTAGIPLVIIYVERKIKKLSYKVVSDTPLLLNAPRGLIEIRIPPNDNPVTDALCLHFCKGGW